MNSSVLLRRLWLSLRVALVAACMLVYVLPQGVFAADDSSEVLVITVDDAISPAVANYIIRGLDEASASNSALVLLRLNTPGGLDTAMRDIIQAILDSEVPVVVQVWPKGGRAASAGAFILLASHVAVMAPATNVGAASPVSIGGDIEEGVMKAKVTNDSIAYIREIAALRNRNAQWAEDAVADAASIGAEEALLIGVIEYIADDIDSVLAAVDGHSVSMPDADTPMRIASSGLAVREFASTWRDGLLAVIANPAVAGILMLIGLYSLIGELYSGGATIVFGVIGVLCLLLGMYALQIVPGFGIAMTLFVFGGIAVSMGILKGTDMLLIPGLIAILLGLLIFSTETLMPMAEAGTLLSSMLFWSLLLLFVGLCVLSLFVLYSVRRATTVPLRTGDSSYVGRDAQVVDATHVSLDGVLWQARAKVDMVTGQKVRVTAVDGLVLQVESPSG